MTKGNDCFNIRTWTVSYTHLDVYKRQVKEAAAGISLDAPEGKITIDGENQHIYKPVRIGMVNADGLIDEVWSTPEPVKPDPYLKGYEWAAGLSGAQ